jgi:hypothetical protein
MGETVRAGAELSAAVQQEDGAVLHTTAGTTVSWAALHLLAERGFRWAPEAAHSTAPQLGRRLHVDLVIEHDPAPGILLGVASSRFVGHAFGAVPRFALVENGEAITPDRLTLAAERRSPQDALFVVTTRERPVLGGVLVVQRAADVVLETLRCTIAVPPGGDSALHAGLEAGLRSVMHGHHARSARFALSRGRTDGVVDTSVAGPPAPFGVYSAGRAARAHEAAADTAGSPHRVLVVGSERGVVSWFPGSERERWAAAAVLVERLQERRSRAAHASDLRAEGGSGEHGTRVGGER